MSLLCWEKKENFAYYESDERRYKNLDFESLMQFRLIYDGPLWATTPGNSRAEHKHDIRKIIHRQLRELWQTQQPMKGIFNHKIPMTVYPQGKQDWFRKLDKIADRHCCGQFRFVPLISEQLGLACALDILFLRRENPGELLDHGGDLDNRMKTLFDALQIPKSLDEKLFPERDENPLFVLLEDDILVTRLAITTDRLLIPLEKEQESTHVKNNIHLIIQVDTQIVNP